MRPREVASLLAGIRAEHPYGQRRLARCFSIEDLAAAARRRLPRAPLDYLEGGGEGEYTLRRNRAAFDEIEFLPRVLRDVSDVDAATTVLGEPVPAPVALAPVGAPRFLHPAGERAVARAAGRAALPYAISTVGSVAIDDVARVATGPLWLQLYVGGDRGRAQELLDRASALGYRALLLTVDASVRSKRERELHHGMTLPDPSPPVTTLLDSLRHPAWTWRFLTSPFPRFPNAARSSAAADGADLSPLFDGTVGWDDVAWIRDRWAGPLVLKGVLDADDAVRAAAAGADAVVVSNHGGRQLDHVPATIDRLADVVDAAGDRLEVLFDSGVRRGTDVLAALALGARGVLVGRAYLYGLAVAGEAGVRFALDVLTDELRRAMALVGARTIGEIDRSLIRRRVLSGGHDGRRAAVGRSAVSARSPAG